MPLIFLLTLYLLFAKPAYAYLDPGTGSYIIQIIIATMIGGTVAFRNSFGKIKEYFTKNLKTPTKKVELDKKKKNEKAKTK